MRCAVRFVVAAGFTLCMSLLLQSTVVQVDAADSLFLFRLKRLRNVFYGQLQDQLNRTNDDIDSFNWRAFIGIVAQLDGTQQYAVQEIGRLQATIHGVLAGPEGCADAEAQYENILHGAEELFHDCIDGAVKSAGRISKHLHESLDTYNKEPINVGFWFLRAYLNDFQSIQTFDHYQAVVAQLSAKVVQWDNVDSIGLFANRIYAQQEIDTLSADVWTCSANIKEFIVTQSGRFLKGIRECISPYNTHTTSEIFQ